MQTIGKTIAAFGFVAASILITDKPVLADSFIPFANTEETGCIDEQGVEYVAVPGTKPKSCDVYPSIVGYTGTAPDGTEATLRCAWQAGESGPIVDQSYRETAKLSIALPILKQLPRLILPLPTCAKIMSNISPSADRLPIITMIPPKRFLSDEKFRLM